MSYFRIFFMYMWNVFMYLLYFFIISVSLSLSLSLSFQYHKLIHIPLFFPLTMYTQQILHYLRTHFPLITHINLHKAKYAHKYIHTVYIYDVVSPCFPFFSLAAVYASYILVLFSPLSLPKIVPLCYSVRHIEFSPHSIFCLCMKIFLSFPSLHNTHLNINLFTLAGFSPHFPSVSIHTYVISSRQNIFPLRTLHMKISLPQYIFPSLPLTSHFTLVHFPSNLHRYIYIIINQHIFPLFSPQYTYQLDKNFSHQKIFLFSPFQLHKTSSH